MDKDLPPTSNPRLVNNNFDLLRLLFALTVCVVHTYILSGYQDLKWVTELLSTKIAVEAFFVVSGFLIFMSYERSHSIGSYFSKRVRRIYPAYFVVIMASALGLWIISSSELHQYFSTDWLKYVASNLLFMNFIHQSLPGVFEGQIFEAVNGALWTLKIEVMFYASVPVLVYLFRRFGYLPAIVTVYALSFAYSKLMLSMAEQTDSGIYAELARQLPGQLSYFMAGAFIYYYLPLFERYIMYFVAIAVLVFVLPLHMALSFIEPIALAVLVAFFGLYGYVGKFGKYGDFSYGVYIIHFPVIQVFLQLGLFRNQPGYYLVCVVGTTVIGAIALWHLVEKRFLLRNNHYISATR